MKLRSSIFSSGDILTKIPTIFLISKKFDHLLTVTQKLDDYLGKKTFEGRLQTLINSLSLSSVNNLLIDLNQQDYSHYRFFYCTPNKSDKLIACSFRQNNDFTIDLVTLANTVLLKHNYKVNDYKLHINDKKIITEHKFFT